MILFVILTTGLIRKTIVFIVEVVVGCLVLVICRLVCSLSNSIIRRRNVAVSLLILLLTSHLLHLLRIHVLLILNLKHF